MADSEPDWKMRQQIEQATGAIREAGPLLWAYYDGLVKAGFADAAALHLTADYARALFYGKSDRPE